MSTDYYGTPSFAERVIAADIIVIGTSVRMVAVEPTLGGSLRALRNVEIRVESLWKGQPDATFELRVLGKREGDRITWIVDLAEREHYLLMLARDSAPPNPAVWYVPYFSAAYPLTADGRIRLPTEILDERTKEITGISGPEVSVEALRKVVDVLLREREEKRRRFEELLPAGLQDEPYAPIGEMPDESPGAGRSAPLDGTPPN